jgi:hypothetical protein
MSTVRANSITNSAGSGAPDFPNGLTDNSNAVLNSSSSLPAANLTGNLPAINGSALTNLPDSVTHLGTISTTSGFTVTLSGLTLTSYKFLVFVYSVVSFNSAGSMSLNGSPVSATTGTGSGTVSGNGTIDLTNGVAVSCGSTGHANAAPSGLTTASTSISFTGSSAFDAGSIRIYGVK